MTGEYKYVKKRKDIPHRFLYDQIFNSKNRKKEIDITEKEMKKQLNKDKKEHNDMVNYKPTPNDDPCSNCLNFNLCAENALACRNFSEWLGKKNKIIL